MAPVRLEFSRDRLSDLPDGIREKILRGLPMKDAFRTCVLSTKWRSTSRELLELRFDEFFFLTRTKFINIVDTVLANRSVHVKYMVITRHGDVESEKVSSWVLRASELLVRELVLHATSPSPFPSERYELCNIPIQFYSNHLLTCLELIGFRVDPPPSAFGKFQDLLKVSFWNVFISPEALSALSRDCRSLKQMTLTRIVGCSRININSATLEYLQVCGWFEEINLVNTQRLTYVVIDKLDPAPDGSLFAESKLSRFFSEAANLQILGIRGHFMKYLAAGRLPRSGMLPLSDLHILHVCLKIRDPAELSALMCIMRSSPALYSVVLRASDDEAVVEPAAGEVLSWTERWKGFKLNNLRSISLHNVSKVNVDRQFVRSLLLCTPVLERLTLVQGWECCCELQNYLVTIPAASGQARIECRDLCAMSGGNV